MTVRIAAVASFAELLQQSGPSFSQSTRHGDSVDPIFNMEPFRLPRVLRPCPFRRIAAAFSLAASPALSQGIAPPDEATVAARMEVFNSPCPGSVYALQPFLNAQEVTSRDGTIYRLTSLNTHVNAWFVLDIDTPMGGARPITLKTRTGCVAGVAGR
jgi:hypothetical protein